MSKILLFISILAIPLVLQAEEGPYSSPIPDNPKNSNSAISGKVEIVINQEMINKFNNYEYTTDEISLSSLLLNLNFNDIRIIAEGISSGTIETVNNSAIASLLEQKSEEVIKTDRIILDSEKILKSTE